MSDSLCIEVYGIPRPQGSKRAFMPKGARNPVLVESSKHVKGWREAIVSAAREAIGDREPIAGPVHLGVEFRFARPKSHYRTGRHWQGLKPDAPRIYMDKMPDLSKLVRAAEDALTDAGVWTDDCLVAGIDARKVYYDRYGAAPPGASLFIDKLPSAPATTYFPHK